MSSLQDAAVYGTQEVVSVVALGEVACACVRGEAEMSAKVSDRAQPEAMTASKGAKCEVSSHRVRFVCSSGTCVCSAGASCGGQALEASAQSRPFPVYAELWGGALLDFPVLREEHLADLADDVHSPEGVGVHSRGDASEPSGQLRDRLRPVADKSDQPSVGELSPDREVVEVRGGCELASVRVWDGLLGLGRTVLTPARVAILEDVNAERERQEHLYATGTLPMIASRPECPNELRLAALIEEVGEVGRAILDGEPDELREELVQVAAVAVAWLEAL